MRGNKDRPQPISLRRYYGMVLRRGFRDWWAFIRRNVIWELVLLAGLAGAGFLIDRTDAGVDAVLTPLIVLAAVVATALGGYLILAPVRVHRELETARDDSRRELSRYAEGGPSLSFGKPEIPPSWQEIGLPIDFTGAITMKRRGRVIRVPVINARGAGEAHRVHARLTFGEGRISARSFYPSPTQGEWAPDGRTEIDLPGNGMPRLLEVVLVLDQEYPHAFEWTAQSRAANLNGYAVMAVPFQVQIEVMGAGPGVAAPYLKEALEIECRSGDKITVDWLGPSRNPDEGTNWMPWDGR